ncbi:hypothetical protein GGS26DRAFT_282682 [Hypomontagnella submonticulosa]|nr:hypothetical protein GGS26DRAFT_282682 [Hypomontagnella submonticulosa]
MSEDVSKFLLQVKELGDRRIEEDEARSRELEERILRERKEREARRAERARSISPQKSSPANTPPPSHRRVDTQGSSSRLNLDSSPILEPPTNSHTQSAPDAEEMAAPGAFSTSASKENEMPVDLEHKSSGQTSPTRSRGLSWQRRPNSQTSERSRSRPLSVVAAENAARNTPSEPTSATEAISRDQIASALSSKDPSWFRQTADRGASSAAYRRNQVEDSQTVDISLMPAQLPGMSRSPSAEIPKGDNGSQPTSPDLINRLASPLSLSGFQKLDPPASDVQPEAEIGQERSQILSPPSGRSSPSRMDRSGSPTKGMGGFVQSAMMKRSDSIKRWSVQSPAGAQRTDPLVPSRTGGRSRSRPASVIRNSSADMSPNLSQNQEGERQAGEVASSEKPGDSLKLDIKPSPEPQEQESGRTTPPVSPSKTMDPRRWSPTKSSWLESALNKPESPKPKLNPTSTQPAWMAELQKAKAEKAANPSAERSRSPTISHKHQVSIGGLMRSSAPGITTKPVGLGLQTPGITTNISARPDSNNASKDMQSPATPDVKSPSTVDIKSPDSDRASTGLPLPVSKPKPETPPKKDFRANLKPRQVPPASSSNADNEFKNVFGNLRKTTTQNYVAPDELKGNILKGKAALNLTGGPKKTERVDEFKEAILARRKDFQKAQSEGRGITRKDSTASERPIPEGLVKRNELGRSNTIKRDPVASDTTEADSQKPGTASKNDTVQEISSNKLQRFGDAENQDSTSRPVTSRADLPILRRGSSQTDTTSKTTDLPATAQKETGVPGRLPGKIGGSALANRFNPTLAGLLARGPPGSSSTGASTSNSRNMASEGNDNETGSGPKLTHMTKNRARGPKRKAPTSAPATTPSESEQKSTVTTPDERVVSPAQLEKPDAIPTPKSDIISLVDSSKIEHHDPPKPKPQPISLVGSGVTAPISAPEVPKKTTNSGKIHEQVAAFAAHRRQPSSPTKAIGEPNEPTSQPSSPKKLDMKRMSRFFDDSSQPAENSVGTQPAKEVKKDIETPPVIKPSPSFEKPATPNLSKSLPRSPPLNKPKKPLPDPISLGPKKQPSESEAVGSTPSPSGAPGVSVTGGRPLPTIPIVSTPLSSRPLPAEPKETSRPLPTPGPKSPPEKSSPMRSPTKQSHDASDLLGDFFGPERSRKTYNVDAAELLMHRPNVTPTRVQTLSTQLFQFSADGKRLPVPAHHERTLFEREMYICSHTFKDETGRKSTEVYFWAGDEVPASVVEDASIFVSREARALGGKLVKLQQGKETPEFLQALGGIVIVQRGSGKKFDSLAPHMLCGRRYHGHIVFDEQDFTPTSLCSGFPYVVATAGKCYLWKGKGSGVDELSCARLIGMDFALSGEMEEMEEGHEPASFWDLFDAKSKVVSADHWRLKPNYDKYCTRLFYSDAASKQQIVEISPFSQKDLRPTGIYVLDAFFELYVIVGSRAQSQYASFHNALDFAQEYAILAAGMEDRPFVPFSTVVLEGIPRDMKSVFRKWRDADTPTVTNVATGLKRGRSLRVVPLNQALQALSD